MLENLSVISTKVSSLIKHLCCGCTWAEPGVDRYIQFCGPMFVPAFVLSQPNFKVK